MPSPWGFVLLCSAHLHMYTLKINPEGRDFLLRICEKLEL